MQVVPFSGISIILFNDGTNQSAENESIHLLGPPYQVIRDRIPWRHFSVDFVENWEGCKKCLPALTLVNMILRDLCGNLEELSLTFQETHLKFLRKILQERSFPCLKTLKIKTLSPDGPLTTFLKMLVSSAANLEELYFDGCTFFEENFLEGNSAVLVPTCGFRPLRQHVCESLMSALRPNKIEIYQCGPEDFDPELLTDFTPTVLKACGGNLKILRIDALFLVPLMSYGINLESVTELEIGFAGDFLERVQPPILGLLRCFDFKSVFPKLTQVQVVNNRHHRPFSPDQISRFVDEGNQATRKTLPNRASNIKKLKLDDSISACDSIVPFLTEMFPKVKSLYVRTTSPSGFPYTLIWEHFVNLEELSVMNTEWRMPCIGNLDSVFCGIFPEEVAQLREKDEEYLKAVNIVPVMPSITCMRELRSFTLRCFVEPRSEYPHDPAVMFSIVTSMIGFLRCPNLAVTFQAPRATFEEVLNHMSPFIDGTDMNNELVGSVTWKCSIC